MMGRTVRMVGARRLRLDASLWVSLDTYSLGYPTPVGGRRRASPSIPSGELSRDQRPSDLLSIEC